MLQKLAQIDKQLSYYIINADNLPITIILYPFAAFFHPRLILFAYLAVYYFSRKDVHATFLYLLGTGICLLTTTLLKKMTKRPRPELIKTAQKPHHFRKKQKNNSMPSGDAIQSALFSVYLYYLGLPLPYVCLFHMGVCVGRVYYMCHWILDTLAATILGALIAFWLNQLRINGNLVPFLHQIYVPSSEL